MSEHEESEREVGNYAEALAQMVDANNALSQMILAEDGLPATVHIVFHLDAAKVHAMLAIADAIGELESGKP